MNQQEADPYKAAAQDSNRAPVHVASPQGQVGWLAMIENAFVAKLPGTLVLAKGDALSLTWIPQSAQFSYPEMHGVYPLNGCDSASIPLQMPYAAALACVAMQNDSPNPRS